MKDFQDNTLQELNAEELFKAKQRYEELPIPNNINDYIYTGIRRGKKANKQNLYRKLSLIAACFLLFTFVTLVRVSPAFADYVSKIPGLEHIVKLITYDKGLQSAVENDFMQPLDLVDEHDGILFKVDGIIVDESSMVLFYTLENKNYNANQSLVNIGKFEFLDENGDPLKAGFSWGISYPGREDLKDGSFHEKVVAHFVDGETFLPDKLTVRVHLRSYEQSSDKAIRVGEEQEQVKDEYLPSVWEVLIPIDKSKFADMKKIYSLNQKLNIRGQTLTFKNVTIYPTRIALEVDYDPENTAKIFGFDDLKFVNEKGEEWARIANGVTGSKPSEYSEILYFQSNFFTSPEELYLQGSSLRMLPKEECEILVDLDQKLLLKSPAGLELKEVDLRGSGVRVATFALRVDPQDESRGFGVFPFNFKDASGIEFDMKSQGSHSSFEIDNTPQQEILLELPDEDYLYPLSFIINDYPNRVKQDFRFKVK